MDRHVNKFEVNVADVEKKCISELSTQRERNRERERAVMHRPSKL